MRTLARALSGVALVMLMSTASLSAQQMDVAVEIEVGSDVVDRMPVGTASEFPADIGTVWCWTRVTGAEAGTTIDHVWIRESNEMAVVPLNVGGSSWRTYSRKTIPASWAGDWRVDVRDASGNVLATKSFTVGAPM